MNPQIKHIQVLKSCFSVIRLGWVTMGRRIITRATSRLPATAGSSLPMSSSTLPPIVLAFSASDPTGGAGVQADLLTLASMGCHALSVITAITVQDTAGVENLQAVDSEWVVDQARLVLEDMPVAAFKVGMVGSIENIAAIAEVVSDYPDVPLVFDPVLASGRGDELATEDMISAMCELLLPQTTILTPNSREARRLVQGDGEDDDELALPGAAEKLLGLGCEYVLITGTHENTPQVVNTLYGPEGVVRSDSWERLPGSYHGSGCTLAAAIAATLANADRDLAIGIGADGLHVGREDISVAAARAQLGKDRLLGVSCYDKLELALAAREAGADYVAFGSAFPSATKPQATRAPLSLYREAKGHLGSPVVAIGGITTENARTVIEAGADAVAVISALFDAPDIEAAARGFSRLFEKNP